MMKPGSSLARVSGRVLVARVARVTCAAALVLAVASSAHAQPAADRETARALFDDGKKKRDAGNLNGALESFQSADAIVHAPTTGLAVARTLAALGQLTEARDAALQIEQLAPAAKESVAFADARRSARELAAELAPRIPSLTIVLKGAPAGVDPAVTIDGVPLPAAVMRVPRRLDPGKHVLVATLRGQDAQGEAPREVRGEITLAEREARSIELDVSALSRPRPAAQAEVAPSAPAPRATTKGSYSPLLWVGLGVAAAGAAAGTITGLVSMGKASDAESGCLPSNKCPPATHDALDGARTFATISTIAFVVAGAGAGTAVVALVLGKKPSEQRAARLTPWLTPTSAGLTGTF
jgi:hypothetical protein